MSKKTPLSQGFIARVAAGVRYAFTGNADGWFDAGEPLAPVAQQAEGRRFDYEPFYNVGHSKPREREAIDFTQLRVTVGYRKAQRPNGGPEVDDSKARHRINQRQ